jgi:elongin-A
MPPDKLLSFSFFQTEKQMESGRKPLSLLELCVRNVIDNLRYVDSMDGVEMQLLKRILPHCTLEQLTHIESRTEVLLLDLTRFLSEAELWL